MKRYWSEIPDDTEFLIVHGPPYGILDAVMSGEWVGCEDMIERINNLKNLKLVQYGHIHEDYGHELINDVHYINASVLNLRYELQNNPFIFEVDENKELKTIQ